MTSTSSFTPMRLYALVGVLQRPDGGPAVNQGLVGSAGEVLVPSRERAQGGRHVPSGLVGPQVVVGEQMDQAAVVELQPGPGVELLEPLPEPFQLDRKSVV